MSQVLRSNHLIKVDPAVNTDKFYDLALCEEQGALTVVATYGRRGAAKPQHDTKYQGPDKAAAERAYEKTLAEKLRGGYTSEGEALAQPGPQMPNPRIPDPQIGDAQKALGDYILEQIDVMVMGGLQDPSGIIEDAFELGFYDPEECEGMTEEEVRAAVTTVVRARIAVREAEKLSWPAVTDNDRLRRAFEALVKRGVLTLEDRASTQSDSYEEFLDDYRAHPNQDRVIGYCFYHRQDVERAVQGGGLYLAFGPRPDTKDEKGDGVAAGAVIVEELRGAGLEVTWDGTFAQRIYLPKFDWKRR